MNDKERIKNDIATLDRREIEDKTLMNNRGKNDEMTQDRRLKADIKETASDDVLDDRIRNDESTSQRRSREDREVDHRRIKNDETTIIRREKEDEAKSIKMASVF